jgi:hypothetical protein
MGRQLRNLLLVCWQQQEEEVQGQAGAASGAARARRVDNYLSACPAASGGKQAAKPSPAEPPLAWL